MCVKVSNSDKTWQNYVNVGVISFACSQGQTYRHKENFFTYAARSRTQCASYLYSAKSAYESQVVWQASLPDVQSSQYCCGHIGCTLFRVTTCSIRSQLCTVYGLGTIRQREKSEILTVKVTFCKLEIQLNEAGRFNLSRKLEMKPANS